MANDDDEALDESYYDKPEKRRSGVFDVSLLREPVTCLPVRRGILMSPSQTVTEAMRAMQSEHQGHVLITEDGTDKSTLLGIFTERDVLLRIVDRGRNPATLALGEVMTSDPEALSVENTVAYALNKMSVGGFRHVPVVDAEFRPAFVVSVRDVVEFLVQAFPREVLNIPASPRSSPKAREGA